MRRAASVPVKHTGHKAPKPAPAVELYRQEKRTHQALARVLDEAAMELMAWRSVAQDHAMMRTWGGAV